MNSNNGNQSITTTGQIIKKIMQDHPSLNSYGMGLDSAFNKKTKEFRDALLKENKEKLLASELAFERSLEWLFLIKKGNHINTRHTSYGYKHSVESYFSRTKEENIYIPQGVLIAAAIYCGFRYELIPGHSNVMLNFDERSLRKVEKMIYLSIRQKRMGRP